MNHLLFDPGTIPHSFSLEDDTVWLWRGDLQTLRSQAFHDGRFLDAQCQMFSTSLSALSLWSEKNIYLRSPTVILHGAFCGSTLLTKYLDRIPGLFCFREPYLATQIAVQACREVDFLEHTMRNLAAGVELLKFIFRDREKGIQTVTKLSDRCNLIAPHLMTALPSLKCIIVSPSLAQFVAAVSSRPDRQDWILKRAADFTISNLFGSDRHAIADSISSFDEAAGFVWLLYQILFSKLEQNYQSSRIFRLTMDDVLLNPSNAITHATEFIGASVNSEGDQPPFVPIITDSKSPEFSIDPAARRIDHLQRLSLFDKQIDCSRRWIESYGDLLTDGTEKLCALDSHPFSA